MVIICFSQILSVNFTLIIQQKTVKKHEMKYLKMLLALIISVLPGIGVCFALDKLDVINSKLPHYPSTATTDNPGSGNLIGEFSVWKLLYLAIAMAIGTFIWTIIKKKLRINL